MDFEEYSNYRKRIFSISGEEDFRQAAMDAFRIQYRSCPVYRKYVDLTGTDVSYIKEPEDIPFLPISLFKSELIETDNDTGTDRNEVIFSSSATTGMKSSSHIVKDISIYEESFTEGFRHFYGNESEYTILGLLPSYLERTGSSLVYMVDRLMENSGSPDNGYYLYEYRELESKLLELKEKGRKTILFGVTFALLDMAETIDPVSFRDLIVLETGGMKGRGKETSREEVHRILTETLGIEKVHSEYGMAELLSQAYSKGDGIFMTPPWMKVYIRDIHNPFRTRNVNEGGLNIIDLANINSCCFIETEDRGHFSGNGFTVDGRIRNAETRGCNMLI